MDNTLIFNQPCWDFFMESLGFFRQIGYNTDWSFNTDGKICWHLDSFVVYFHRNLSNTLQIGVVYQPSNPRYVHAVTMLTRTNASNVQQFIESLINPDLRALCLNDIWCLPIISALAK